MHKRYSYTQSHPRYLYAEVPCSEVPQRTRTSCKKFPFRRRINSGFYLNALNVLCVSQCQVAKMKVLVFPKFSRLQWQAENVCSFSVSCQRSQSYLPLAHAGKGGILQLSPVFADRKSAVILSCWPWHKLNKGTRQPLPIVPFPNEFLGSRTSKLFMLRKSRKVSCPQQKSRRSPSLKAREPKGKQYQKDSQSGPNFIISII